MVFMKNYSNGSVFSVFTQTQKNKTILNLCQKELLMCFSEYIKMWPSHNLLNWKTSDWLLTLLIPMLILCYFEYTTVLLL